MDIPTPHQPSTTLGSLSWPLPLLASCSYPRFVAGVQTNPTSPKHQKCVHLYQESMRSTAYVFLLAQRKYTMQPQAGGRAGVSFQPCLWCTAVCRPHVVAREHRITQGKRLVWVYIIKTYKTHSGMQNS